MLAKLALVFLGGGLGAVARYLTVLVVDRAFAGAHGFPTGTLVVNIVGSFLIGVLGGLAIAAASEDDTAQYWRLALIVGVLGGFTTMSSFAAEVVKLLEDQRVVSAILYVVSTNVGCVVAAATGGLAASRLAS